MAQVLPNTLSSIIERYFKLLFSLINYNKCFKTIVVETIATSDDDHRDCADNDIDFDIAQFEWRVDFDDHEIWR